MVRLENIVLSFESTLVKYPRNYWIKNTQKHIFHNVVDNKRSVLINNDKDGAVLFLCDKHKTVRKIKFKNKLNGTRTVGQSKR